MNVKNYRGRTAEECIQKVKLEMGRDAVILQSRTLRRPLFGMLGPAMHEIVAVSDGNTLLDTLGRRAAARDAEREPVAIPAPPRLTMTSGQAAARSPFRPTGRLTLAEAATMAESSAEGREAALAMIAEAAGLRTGDNDRVARIEKQVAVLTKALAPPQPPQPMPRDAAEADAPTEPRAEPEHKDVRPTVAAGKTSPFLRYRIPAAAPERNAPPPTPLEIPVAEANTDDLDDPYQPLFDRIRRARVAEALVRRLRSEMPDGLDLDEAQAALHDLLARRLLISGAIRPSAGKVTVAALIGPTGVGKTTTAAKLAASLGLSGAATVGLISLDTRRVAGTAQLTTYGEILGIPVRVAYDKPEMETAIGEMASRGIDVVLVDTPGCGTAEELSFGDMSASLRHEVDLGIYLVMPATLSASNFEHTIRRFTKPSTPEAMILSKLDETADNHCLGFLMNCQAKYRLPLAYVTTGARVPNDLEHADAHALATKILTISTPH